MCAAGKKEHPAQLFEPVLLSNGIYEHFNSMCSTDQVSRDKQYPDIFLLVAEQLSVDPGDCIVFEDIAAAVHSAKKCGMQVFGVYDSHNSHYIDEILSVADGFLYN